MRRTILHQILAGHAEAMGIRLLWKTPVAGVEDGAARLKDGSVRARWIIGADGGQSRARRWSGLESSRKGGQRIAWQRHYRMQPWSEFVEIHWAPGLQAYVTPTSPEEICVVTLGESAGDADFDRVLGVLPELRQRLASAEWIGRKRGAITETRSLARVWRGNIALVGDASGSVDAITGEGMRLAFQQAVALAEALQRNDLRSYERAHRRLARRPSLMSTLLLQLGQHDSVRRRVLSVFSRKNEIFEKFLAFHVGKATAVDLVKTGAQLSWQFLTAGG